MAMTQDQLEQFLRTGVLLSAERDPARLMEQLLSQSVELARCDGGAIFLAGQSRPKLTLPAEGLPPAIGSTLSLPMLDRTGEAMGELRLVNARDEGGKIVPFPEDMALALGSVASLAAVAIQNAQYIGEVKGLFDSFVRVMSSAVDARSPYNGNHTRHMAACGAKFIDYLNARAVRLGEEPPFSPDHREELLMSIWLHDIGKLVIPSSIMDKPTRLHPAQYNAFLHRLEVIRLRGEIQLLREQIGHHAYHTVLRDLTEARELVDRINAAPALTSDMLRDLDRLAARTYVDEDGFHRPWLTEEEHAMLSIPRGTLTHDERETMKGHVTVTDRFLAQIHFPPGLSHVRAWAAAHHEFLNGSGYPDHLRGDEIPTEVRIITILDIFDALTADDRPYKPGIPVEDALTILSGMARIEGKLDPHLTQLFIDSRCWE